MSSESKSLALEPTKAPAVRLQAAPPHFQPLTVYALAKCLRRNWKRTLMVAVGLGGMLALVIYALLPPLKPHAYAKIYFPAKPTVGMFQHPDAPVNQQTEREYILSRGVLVPTVQKPEIAELETIREKGDPAGWLSNALQVEFANGSEIMKVTLTGDRPEELQKIINGLKSVYLDEIKNKSLTMRQRNLKQLETGLAKAKQEYEQALETIRGKDPESGTTYGTSKDSIEAKLLQANGEEKTLLTTIERMKRDLARVQKQLETAFDSKDPTYEALFIRDEEITALQKQRREIEKMRDRSKPFVAPDHPSLKSYADQLESIQKEINGRKQELLPVVEGQLRAALQLEERKLQQELAISQSLEQGKKEEVELLTKKLDTFSKPSFKQGGSELSQKDLEVREFQAALNKYRFEQEASLRADTLEDAIIVRPNNPERKMRFAMLGFFVAAGFVTLMSAFLEYRARRLNSAEEVVAELRMPLVGTVPLRPTHPRGQLLTPLMSGPEIPWEKLLNESVDSARTLFLHTADTAGLRVIMITSAVGGEGKTSLSWQLAKSLARSGRRVLLVDGDLRNPTLHGESGAPLFPGVCEVLRKEADLDDAVRPSSVHNLAVLPAGHCDAQALMHLAQDGFRKLVNEVRTLADIVLIDSSPVLPVADALLMARYVDGVLISLMCDVSQVDRVNSATQRLQTIGTRIIGAVVSGTPTEQYGYGIRYVSTNPS